MEDERNQADHGDRGAASERDRSARDSDRLRERPETWLRLGTAVLFAIVAGVLDPLIILLSLFQHAYALVTGRAPSRGVRELGNVLAAYYYRVIRYATWCDDERPFPFGDLPEAFEDLEVLQEDEEAPAR